MQSSCVKLLHNHAEELLSMGRALFDSAQKVKTMGLDKNRLVLVLTEVCHLCQVITILLPQLFSSSTPSPTSDYAFLAVDTERTKILFDDLLALFNFLMTSMPPLMTHQQLFHQLFQRLDSLIASWVAFHGTFYPLNNSTPKRKGDNFGTSEDWLQHLSNFLTEYIQEHCKTAQKQKNEVRELSNLSSDQLKMVLSRQTCHGVMMLLMWISWKRMW